MDTAQDRDRKEQDAIEDMVAMSAPVEVEVIASDVLNPGFGYSVIFRDAKGTERKARVSQFTADHIMALVLEAVN